MTKRATRPPPTPERLRELFNYCPITGDLTRKVPRGGIKAGVVAGALRPDGYRHVRVDGRYYLVHRVIYCMVKGHWPAGQLDHENTVRDDLRWTNIREATHAQNSCNTPARSRLGKGVQRSRKKFKAFISINGKPTYLGTFDTAHLAAEAYADAAERHHGAFARTVEYRGVFARTVTR